MKTRSHLLRLAVIALPLALCGCPAFLSDNFQIADGSEDARASIVDVTSGADQTVESGPVPDASFGDGESTDGEVADGEVGLPTVEAEACADATPPNTNIGVFVAPTGVDVTGCGSSTSKPCASITAALATAAGPSGRTTIYVAAGKYIEEVKLVPGVTVQGGWHFDGANWTLDCSAAPWDLVTVQAPATSNVTVLADTIGGAATLSTVTVLSKSAAGVLPSESLYGIFARGSSTNLTLTDVTVLMQSGGDGKAGAQGATGAAAAAASTKCASDDGANGNSDGGVATGTGATGDVYSSAGFTPQSGGTGPAGAGGDNGTAGGAGGTASYTVCTSPSPCAQGSMTCTGSAGLNGCGGGGGQGGTGGSGGGSSIALFAYDATVTVNSGSYTAGNGGHGAAGGSGGNGAAGSAAATGAPAVCAQSSCVSSACQIGSDVSPPGGAAGGQGGHGSAGGQGGGGSGGDSYAIMTGGMATAALVQTGSPTLTKGSAGTSLGNGVTGMAGSQGSF